MRYGIPALASDNFDDSLGLVELRFVSPSSRTAQDVTEPVNLIDSHGQLIPFDTVRSRGWLFDDYISYGTLDVTMGSRFATQYSGFFISQPPRSLHEPDATIRFVLAPTDVPTRYCQDGYMAFVSAVPSGSVLRMRTVISLVNNISGNMDEAEVIASSVPTEAKLFLSHSITLPHDIYSIFVEEIEAITQMTFAQYERSIECHRLFDSLPTIRYTLLDDSSNGVVEVFVGPSDYILFDPSAERKCQIQITGNDIHYQSFGLPFLRSAGVFVDYGQQRFGICDPL